MPTASVLLVDAIITTAAMAGVERRTFLATLGIAEAALRDPEARVSLDIVTRAWELAAGATGDDAFGMHFGERTAFGVFDVIDWLARSSTTASDAAGRIATLHRWLNDAARVTLSRDANHACVTYELDAPWSPGLRHASEAAIAAYLSRLRMLTRVHVVPAAVRFAHPAPPSTAEYRRFFATRIEFGASHNELVLARTDSELPIVGADASLQRILDRQARALLAALPVDGIVSVVARCLAQCIRDGEPTLDSIGARIGLTPRSLQRRLAAEGTSFHAVLDQVRREAAVGYLADGVDIADIAARLGYSEPAAFHRAFRRWTGTTPRAYRKR